MFLLICQRVTKFTPKLLLGLALGSGLGLGLGLGAQFAHATNPTPPRVVSLTPHVTELIFAAGAGHTIVATVNASDYPQAALGIDRIGDGLNTSAEQVLARQPDWVMGWPSALMTQLQALGVETVVLEPMSMVQIAQQVRTLGRLLGTESVADAKSQEIIADIAAITAIAAEMTDQSAPRLPVMVLASPDGQYVLGRQALTNDALTLCGARNIFAEALSVAPSVSLEGLIAANPALVISGYEPAAWLVDRFTVAVIDPNWLYRPGPRFVQAMRQICTAVRQARQSRQ
jgi:ABC-type hemin transport system substrate-binding protein